MKKIISLLLLSILSSCNLSNDSTSSSNTQVVEQDSYFNDLDFEFDAIERNEKLAIYEANIINDAKIFPLYTSNKKVLTKVIKSDLCPVIINGNNYYRYKNFAVTNEIISNDYQNKVNTLCYQNHVSYKELIEKSSINDNLTLNYQDDKINSLNIYDFNNKLQNEILLQCQDSLVELDIFGDVYMSLAEDVTISQDNLTYTFTIKDDIYFVDYKGDKHSLITANDFVFAYKYLLTNRINLDVFTNVINNNEYLNGKCSIDEVGVKALDNKTLEIRLANVDSSFLYQLANSCFTPINQSFFESKGNSLNSNKYGMYGNISDLSNMLFTGAYYISSINQERISMSLNTFHHNVNNISINSINYIKDNIDLYNKFNNGIYSEIEYLDNYDNENVNYKYVDGSIKYALFNVKREFYDVYNTSIKTNKNESQILETSKAINNINFRKAILSCIEKEKYVNNNLLVDSITLYNRFINSTTTYNDYVNSKIIDKITFDEQRANLYFDKFVNETSVTLPIVLDVLTYSKNYENLNNALKVKESIESILGSDKVVIDIIKCESLFDYYLANYQNYACYDFTLDFTVNPLCSDNSAYLKEIYEYI